MFKETALNHDSAKIIKLLHRYYEMRQLKTKIDFECREIARRRYGEEKIDFGKMAEELREVAIDIGMDPRCKSDGCEVAFLDGYLVSLGYIPAKRLSKEED